MDMSGLLTRLGLVGSTVVMVAVLAACSSKPANRAPVEDRSASATKPAVVPVTTDGKPLPGAENAGKPGYYTIRRGDSLMRIGLDTGQAWRDIARWNGIENPNLIEVGQVIRVVPPVGAVASSAASDAPSVAVTRPVTSSSVTPVTPGTVVPGPAPAASAAASAAAPVASASTSPAAASAAPAAVAGEDEIAFIWPSSGVLLAGFDEAKNKGVDLGGKPGDPVQAAADGRVVYAGAGLRGYGNLVILKHNNTYLTAYAHNQTLLVKEDQSVRKGQKIAEMGNSDADRVKLHFEIRRQGKPVDPAKYLPAR
jgi:lipoprotein NlpD